MVTNSKRRSRVKTALERVRAEDPNAGTRGRLIDAAISTFAAKGFHGATTRDIATAAGMSPAAVYVHFSTKEELLYTIMRDGHTLARDLVRASIATSADPTEQLYRAIYNFTMWHARRHTRARITNYELGAISPDHLTEIRRLRNEINALMRETVENGVAAGQFTTPDVRLTVAALLSITIDVTRWYTESGPTKAEEVAAHYGLLALRVVGAGDHLPRVLADA